MGAGSRAAARLSITGPKERTMKKLNFAIAAACLASASPAVASPEQVPATVAEKAQGRCGIWGWLGYCQMSALRQQVVATNR